MSLLLDEIVRKGQLLKELTENKDNAYYTTKIHIFREAYKEIVKIEKSKDISKNKDKLLRDYLNKIEQEDNSAKKSAYKEITKIIKDDQLGILKEPQKIKTEQVSDNSIKDNSSYVVFDIETTGLNNQWDEIIQIAAEKIVKSNGQWEIRDKFNSFIKPKKKIPNKIIDLTGITNEMVKEAPSIFQVLPKFIEFIDNLPLIAHNIAFDLGFIKSKIKFYNTHKKYGDDLSLDCETVDTLKMARELLPNIANHKLATVVVHFGLEFNNHHRADKDAEITTKIFLKLLELKG